MTDNRKAEAMTVPLAQSNLPSVVERNECWQALGQAAFWRPRHAEASPVLGQVPFLFWLAELTSSRLIVQMGLDDGIAYLALCQAAERLSGNAICLPLDAEEASLTPALQAEHDWHYSDFSQIISGDKAVASLPEGIDLLVIAAPLERDGWDLLRDSVLPRLSNSAVLVVMNPDAVLADQTARRTLTGADQLHLSLQPVVPGGAAIDVILYGVKQPEQLRSLAGQPGRSSWLAIRQAFNRLGQGIVAIHQNRDLLRNQSLWQDRLKQAEAKIETLKAEVEKAEASEKIQHHRQAEMAAQVHDLQRAVAQAEDVRKAVQIERDNLAQQVAELTRAKEQAERERKAAEDNTAMQLAEMRRAMDEARAEHEARIEDIAVLTARHESDREQTEKRFKAQLAEEGTRVADLQRSVSQANDARSALEIERDALASQVAELVRAKEDQRDTAAQLAEMRRAIEDARAEHDARIEDIVVLTAAYEDSRQQAEKKFKTQLAKKNKHVADLQRDLAQASNHRDALLGSTSWKITSPLRKVISMARGY